MLTTNSSICRWDALYVSYISTEGYFFLKSTSTYMSSIKYWYINISVKQNKYMKSSTYIYIYRVSQKTWEFSDEFDIVFVIN